MTELFNSVCLTNSLGENEKEPQFILKPRTWIQRAGGDNWHCLAVRPPTLRCCRHRHRDIQLRPRDELELERW